MDINYLLYREQIERARADALPPGGARSAHSEMADAYRELRDQHRRSLRQAAGAGPDLDLPRL